MAGNRKKRVRGCASGVSGISPLRDCIGSSVYALIQSFKTLFLMHGAACRFEPSCARYAGDAVRMLPPHIAVIKIVWRVLRCNPFSKGGYDPVIKVQKL